YVTQEHPVPVAWLLESLETVRSSPSNRKRPSASQRPRHPEQQDQQRQQRVLDLNAADSAALEAMPYIGPVLAARICRFRNALGGFHAVEQLREVWGLKPEAAERLMPMFHTGRGVYHTLCADTATWFELKSHPYIDAKAASAIERYRRHHPLDSLEALADAIPITDSMIRRWSPYLRLCEHRD
ncbi:MAG: helix-hairpin-helix domain-containing protein, partial [Flavobacteriales bacterium]